MAQGHSAARRADGVVSRHSWHRQVKDEHNIIARALWVAFQAPLRSLAQVPALLVLPCGPHPQRLPVPDGSLTTAEKYLPQAFCQSSEPGRTSRVPWTTHGVARRGPASRRTADTAALTAPRSGAR